MASRSPHNHSRLFNVGGREVTVALRRSPRRSIGLVVGPDGLVVTMPNRFPLGELDAILRQKANWILGKLDDMAARPSMMTLQEFSEIDWLGEPHQIRIGYSRASVTADELRLCAHESKDIPDALSRLMRREAKGFLGERLAHWSARLRLSYSAFKLSSARSRWGSCTSQAVIRLNWRLMQAPIPVIDYVIIHELCHLLELNHSPRFWALVEMHCPDWKHKRDWLKDEGVRYFAW